MAKLLKVIFGVALAVSIGLSFRPVVSSADEAATPRKMTAKDIGEYLSASVMALTSDGVRTCTATKIGLKTFLTAKHCVVPLTPGLRVEKGVDLLSVRAVSASVSKKRDGVKTEDWATLLTWTDNERIKSLPLGCTEEIYLGMPVAYVGYPNPLELTMSIGRVISVLPVASGQSNSAFVTDLAAAPGASGSAVVSLETGQIIGILIEGVRDPRAGFWATGIEGIKSLPYCDTTPGN